MRRVAFCRKSFLNKKDMKSLLKKGHQLSPSKLLTVQMKIQSHNHFNISDMSAKNGKKSENQSVDSEESRGADDQNSRSRVSKKSWFKNTSIEINNKPSRRRSADPQERTRKGR